tara:strand:+ start:665 stop:1138 length:474 start_codon:yes stop_codon:yes gene_type:complete
MAAQLMKCGKTSVKFDKDNISLISEAITKSDIRGLIKDGVIKKSATQGVSHSRLRKHLKQKRKGRRSGPGTKSGTHKARIRPKKEWMNKIRAIRDLLSTLKEKGVIDSKTHRTLYRKSKGGFFRSRRHIKLYIEEHKLEKNEESKKKRTSVQKKKAK